MKIRSFSECDKDRKRNMKRSASNRCRFSFLHFLLDFQLSQFLFCTLLFVSTFTPTRQVNNDESFELQPSKILLPLYRESESTFNEESLESTDNTKHKSCRFQARPGRLFNHSIFEMFEEPHIKTEFSKVSLVYSFLVKLFTLLQTFLNYS